MFLRRFLWIGLLIWLMPALVRGAVLLAGPGVEVTGAREVVVRWETDVPTRGRLEILPGQGLPGRRIEGDVARQHALPVAELVEGRRYRFVVGTARQPLATNVFVAGRGLVAGGEATGSPAAPGPGSVSVPSPADSRPALRPAPPTRETWGSLPSLQDHFDRHGADFRARDPDEYARLAWEFRERAHRERLPAKVDESGVVRIYDPGTGAFGAYNRDGTTRTYFKPRSRDYFERQPGRRVTLPAKP